MMQSVVPIIAPNTEVTIASDGKGALDKHFLGMSCPFDLVITGIMMPGLDGLALTAILKKRFPKLPIIIMSGVLRKPEDHRADEYVSKPPDVDILRKTIHRLLEGAEA